MNDSDVAIRIGHEGPISSGVIIQFLRRTHPDCNDYWDGNWISVMVQINAGAFQGSFEASFRSDELPKLLEGLVRINAASEGCATFDTMEGQLAFSITRNKRGQLNVEGTAFDDAGIGNELAFHFEIDQTYLPQMIRDVETALEAFPVVGKDGPR